MSRKWKMTPRHQAVVIVSLVASVMFGIPTAQADSSPGAQVAVTGGMVATGSVFSTPFPDGSERTISVMLVIPDDPVYVSPAGTALDLAQPWVIVNHWEMFWGSEVCSTATNPQSWDRGARVQSAWTSGPYSGTWDQWEGVSVDVSCDDGFYSSYRVTWHPNPLASLSSNKVSNTFRSSNIAWQAGGHGGALQYHPEARQSGDLTICGRRSGSADRPGGIDCYDGNGTVVVETTTTVARTHTTGR